MHPPGLLLHGPPVPVPVLSVSRGFSPAKPTALTYSLFPHCSSSPSALLCPSPSPSTPALASSSSLALSRETAGDRDRDDDDDILYRAVGLIRTTHGVKGELKVVPSTAFPHLRLATPGKRWIRMRDGGNEIIKEIQLLKGRFNPGKQNWLLTFRGINSIEQAKEIIGSTLLVKADDIPQLHEGEFYTPHLIGMTVFLKETGKLVGTVVAVTNVKGNELLKVKPAPTATEEEDSSNWHILIPFVEEIVNQVDMEKGEMQITPPKGLLELNSHSTAGSAKERRLMEWRQKKKSQQRLAAAKKILNEMEQIHVLDALRLAPKAQNISLAKQIASIDFRLFQNAMNNLEKQINGLAEDKDDSFSLLLKNALKISHESFHGNGSETNKFQHDLREKGSDLLSNSKAAIVLIRNEKKVIGNNSATDDDLENFLSGIGELIVGQESNPLVMVTAAHEVQTLHEYLRDNDYFGLDHQKVWVLEKGRFPISSTPSDTSGSKILLKSSYELLEAPVGPGGIFSLLSFQKIFDAFNQMGIEYVQVCSLDNKSSVGNPLFFGYVSSLNADVGVKIYDGNKGDETSFDMIISMKYLDKISKDAEKLGFYAVTEKHNYVEKTTDGWVDVKPEVANSCRLHFPAYGLLNSCPLDHVCVIDISK